MTAAAAPLGYEPAQGDLPTQVQRALTLEESVREAWDKWQDSEKIITELDNKAEQARDDLDLALNKLEQLTAALPLPDRSLEGIRTALPHLRNLQQLYGEYRKLSVRIGALEQAIAALVDSAERLIQILGEPVNGADADPVLIIDRARSRQTLAARADEKREEATLRRDELDRSKRRAETERQDANANLESCFKGQGAQDLMPRDRVAKLVERDRLRTEKAIAERDRQKAREGVDADLFAEEL
ncbi:MAG: hypothetical protein MK186_13330, partial [Henriciella sp.]|nr:hypothetical protein [Henriciella sp.]